MDRKVENLAENLTWLALGAAVGVTVAMLLAPDKGIHTRRLLAKHVNPEDVISRGRELFEKGREIAQEASEMFERGRKMAEAGFDEQMEAEHIFDKGL
jgi:gas vesicle protein